MLGQETTKELERIKKIAERLGQALTWAHVAQACLAQASSQSPYGREPLLRLVINEIDLRILRFLGQVPGERGIDTEQMGRIVHDFLVFDASRKQEAWMSLNDRLLRWLAAGEAQSDDWTLVEVLAIFRRFGLKAGNFDGSLPWPSEVWKQQEEDPPLSWRDQLGELVGLQAIKNEVARLENFLTVQREMQRRGLKVQRLPLHQVFYGNPGTGKTTIARVLAQIYREFGYLERGHLIETDRSGLVGGVIGETEAKTSEKIRQALGGVLFIDEAYSLATENQNDFGQRAIDTLVKAMEDQRDNLVVIVAGYREEMNCFLASNPGLYGRFNRHIEFPDYSSDELMEVFSRLTQNGCYKLNGEVLKIARETLETRKERVGRLFGNARDARSLWELGLQWRAERLCRGLQDADAIKHLSNEELLTLLPEDIPPSF